MTGGHLEPVRLAQYDERLLDAAAAASVAAHLAGCAACSATLARVAQVRATLREAPTEIPVPAAVGSRIDAALAAERRGAARQHAPRLATVHPLRRRLPQLLAAAAAVGVVGFAGYAVVTSSTGGGDSAEQAGGGLAGDAATEERDESATGGEEAAAQVPVPATEAQRMSLTDQIRDIVAGPDNTADDRYGATGGCGQPLAEELGRSVLGTQPTDVGPAGSVLVVVETSLAGEVQGWVLPSCRALPADAITQLTVPLN